MQRSSVPDPSSGAAMLVGEYRMIDVLQDDRLVKSSKSMVNNMISPQMDGGGQGEFGGSFL